MEDIGDAHGAPSLQEIRACLIPRGEASQWDEGELPLAVLNLHDHTRLSRCKLLLRLSCIARRSLDQTTAARAVALREILIELLPKGDDHPSCAVLRALAGLEPGTAGRSREQRQRVAGWELGSERQPADPRTVRRHAKERAWPWLLDRLVELEVRERKAAQVGASDRKLEAAPGAGWASVPGPEEEDAVDRRGFLVNMGKVTAALLAGMCAESVDIDRKLEASDLGRGTLEQLARTVERLGQEYAQRPPMEMMAEVRAWRQYVVRLLEGGRHTLAQRRDLYTVLGWLSCLLGSLAFDLGHGSTAEVHHATALHLAGEAGHNRLAAWVHGEQTLAIYLGQPQRAVALAEAGQELAPAGSVSRVRLFLLEARAHARMGDGVGFEHAMGLAAEAFDHLTEQVGGGIYWFDALLLPYYAGSSYSWLGRPRRAREQAEQAIELCDAASANWPVTRVIARLDRATALVQLREVEDACAVGAEALDICSTDRRLNPIFIRRAGELSSALQPHRALPAVKEFNERFHALCGDPGTSL